MIKGCAVLAAILFILVLIARCGATNDVQPWSGNWSDPTADVIRVLAAKGVRGCGEFYQKRNAKFEGDYAVACTHTPDGRAAWTGYEVFAGTGEVMGPDLTAVYMQFGGPPRELTKDDN